MGDDVKQKTTRRVKSSLGSKRGKGKAVVKTAKKARIAGTKRVAKSKKAPAKLVTAATRRKAARSAPSLGI